MGRLPLILALSLLAAGPATATQFWLSPYGYPLGALGSVPPANQAAVPNIYNFVTQTNGSLYVWARPDAGKTLQNWSLRLHSQNAGNIIRFTTTEVYNPILGGDPNNVRWEYVVEPVTDSATSGEFMGFTLTNNDINGLGISAATATDDPLYYGPLDGSGAWLLARVGYKALNVVGSTDVYLQLGLLGLSNEGEESGDTTVKFGADPNFPATSGNRRVSILNEDANVQVLTTPDADFNNDTVVSGVDFLIWQRKSGLNGGATNADGDANADGNVNHIDLAAWEFQYTATGLLMAEQAASFAVPEPATCGGLVWTLVLLASRRAFRGGAR